MSGILALSVNENLDSELKYIAELIESSRKKEVLLITRAGGESHRAKAILEESGASLTVVCEDHSGDAAWKGAEVVITKVLARLPLKDVIWIPDAGCVYTFGGSVMGFSNKEEELFGMTESMLRRFVKYASITEILRFFNHA